MMEAVLSPGLLLGTRYRIESFIGVSELGEVYAALDTRSGRECCVKLLPAALKHTPAAWKAFQELSRSVAALDAEAIARATDFGTDAAVGRHFVVSERIGFPSLGALIAGHGPLPAALWAQALDAFARSLDAAAGAAILHGDLKPSNLFFAPEHAGWARISDFGMVLLRAACPPGSGVAPLGWAALEQTRGEPASRAGDLFSLGLITYYALTGRHFLASMWQAAPDPRQLLDELEAAPGAAHAHASAQGALLPPALDPWFARALHRDPGARFASAEEAARQFAELSSELPRAVPSEARIPSATVQSSGVAAAVAVPLLFQELPRASASVSATTGEAPHSSRPPGFTAPRAATTEHVAGLPPQPPIALLAAVGVGLIATLGLVGYGLVRLFSSGEKTPSPAAAESSVATALPAKLEPSAPAAAPAATTSAPSQAKTQAHFACAPVACEWVVCDGENVKKGQLELELAPGKHSCSASRYGYRTAVSEFVVEAGKTTRVPFELLPAKAGVSAAAVPAPKAPAPKGAKAVAKPKKPSTTSSKSTPTKSPIVATSKSTMSTTKPSAKTR